MRQKYSVKVVGLLCTPDPTEFYTEHVDTLNLDFGGIPGDRHYGMTRLSGGREKHFQLGTQIKNRRQLSLVSVEELQPLAERLGVAFTPLPGQIGANMLLSGMDKMTKLPPGAVLMFEGGVALHCEGENHPCRFPGDVIEKQNRHIPGLRKAFISEAKGCRGLVASVEKEGKIQVDEVGQILLP